MTSLPPHSAAKLFPLMDEQELAELAQDIKERGLLNPIVVHEGRVLDGRNRQTACEKARVKAKAVSWDGAGGSPTGFVIAQNLHRRHLSSDQRAAIAVEALPMFEAEAKKRLSAAAKTKGTERIPEAGEARAKAAKAFSTNSHYVSDAKALKEKAPDLFEKVRAGDKTIPQAKREQVQRQHEEMAGAVERAMKPEERLKLERANLQSDLARAIEKAGQMTLLDIDQLAELIDDESHSDLAKLMDRVNDWFSRYSAARRRLNLTTVKGGER